MTKTKDIRTINGVLRIDQSIGTRSFNFKNLWKKNRWYMRTEPMKRLITKIVRGFGILLFASTALPAAADEIHVIVSINPQKYFVQQIGGDRVHVTVMVQPGANPATYEPKPRQMVALLKAKIYFAIGVPFENVWLKKIAAVNPKIRIVHTDAGIEKISMERHYRRGGTHVGYNKTEDKYAKRRDHGIKDPHIWLSPPLVKIQARHVLNALLFVDPDHRSGYEANFKKFMEELNSLDEELKAIFKGKTGLLFLVFHPAWGYFAKSYGLIQLPIEVEGKEPKPARLKELIEYTKKNNIRVVFVQPQFSSKSAKIIANAIGGQVGFVDPLAQDWLGNLREVAEKFKAALR